MCYSRLLIAFIRYWEWGGNSDTVSVEALNWFILALAKTAVNTVECAETYQSGARTEGTSTEDKTAEACGEEREK